METENKKIYVLTQDGRWIYASEDVNECWYKLQEVQPQSAYWACKYEGYEVKERDVSETFYIIDLKEFKETGGVKNTMRANGFVDYMDTPTVFDRYRSDYLQKVNDVKDHTTWTTLHAYDWDAFEKMLNDYHKSRITPFVEINEARWYEMLEVLPPTRWTHFNNGSIFFISEATTGTLHQCFVKKNGKCYEALKDITDDVEELFNQID